MKKQYLYNLLAFIVLLSLAPSGFTQVVKEYTFNYDNSGNRTIRMHETTTQKISLKTGWNIFSANVLPIDRDLLLPI